MYYKPETKVRISNKDKIEIAKIIRDNLVEYMHTIKQDSGKKAGDLVNENIKKYKNYPSEIKRVSRKEGKSNLYLVCSKLIKLSYISQNPRESVFSAFSNIYKMLEQRLFPKLESLTKSVVITPKQKKYYLKKEYQIIFVCVSETYKKMLRKRG